MNFAKIYSKFRGSTWFLALLLITITLWLAVHWIFGLDKELGGLNIFLSFEASVSLAFFTMVNDAQMEEQKKQTDAMEALLRKIQQQDAQVLETVEDIKEDLDGK